ncbi:MAG: DUF4301 domain-containing protein [Bacteroidetes bacterium HGW-Bacteroidetes-6]|jgi:hypothetical protein|nr:MAG: DUF4301 domain-containing protein [Bacteroidetes bacterium HGW-Bacteroidetes-6]
MFSSDDIKQINLHGLSVESVQSQIEQFRKGFPFVKLIRPATEDDGIETLHPKQLTSFVAEFDSRAADYAMAKFVPASGAATRMFKDLYKTIDLLKSGNNSTIPESALVFFENIDQFAFSKTLSNALAKKQMNLKELVEQKNYLPVLETLLYSDGLNYGSKPKAFLEFHCYGFSTRTALAEQVYEGLQHAVGNEKKLNVHFTISPEHESEFDIMVADLLNEIKNDITIGITCSFQQKSTDTIAVDTDNNPVRNPESKLVFRPGGHGALLQNLNAIEEELVFLKNIDNVVPDSKREDTITYKKVLAGMLMQIVDQVHGFLTMLDDGNVENDDLDAMMQYASEKLWIDLPLWLKDSDEMEKMDYLYQVFNRPVRVCGMVKNEGEPGGGPFFVENSDGEVSLQIVESSQVNMGDTSQKDIFAASTHFNPVDLVCYLRDFEGDKFDLNDFSDSETGFIARKSLFGQDVKAMELPGLWNGAMADWITVFVEVPLTTFNPVKEVNDLLRENHR